MKGLFGIFLYFLILNKVEMSIVMIDSIRSKFPGEIEITPIGTVVIDEFGVEGMQYEVNFLKDVADGNNVVYVATSVSGEASICNADNSTMDGIMIALATNLLGFENTSPCPIAKGTNNQIVSFFKVNYPMLDDLIESGDDLLDFGIMGYEIPITLMKDNDENRQMLQSKYKPK